MKIIISVRFCMKMNFKKMDKKKFIKFNLFEMTKREKNI